MPEEREVVEVEEVAVEEGLEDVVFRWIRCCVSVRGDDIIADVSGRGGEVVDVGEGGREGRGEHEEEEPEEEEGVGDEAMVRENENVKGYSRDEEGGD